MHGNMLTQLGQLFFVAFGFECNQYADFAQAGFNGIVDISGNNAVADFNHFGAAQIHILANLGNHVGQALFKRLVNFRALKSFHVANFARAHQGNQSGVLDIFLKDFVFGDKIGFGVNLDHGAFVSFNGNGNQTFCGNAAGFFGSGS